ELWNTCGWVYRGALCSPTMAPGLFNRARNRPPAIESGIIRRRKAAWADELRTNEDEHADQPRRWGERHGTARWQAHRGGGWQRFAGCAVGIRGVREQGGQCLLSPWRKGRSLHGDPADHQG